MTEPQVFTIEDYLKLKLPVEAQIHPHGDRVAFTLAEIGKEGQGKPGKSQIWLTQIDQTDPRPLTAGGAKDLAPRWAPDGASIAFLSDRATPGKALQIYLLSMQGGEAISLTDVKGNIDDFAWTHDGKRIAYLMGDPEPESPESDVIAFEDRPLFQRLYLLDMATRQSTAISPPDVQVWEFNESPNGDTFALVASEWPWEWSWYKTYIATISSSGGAVTVISQTDRPVALPRWSPSGDQIAFLSSMWSDRGSVAGGLWLVNRAGGALTQVSDGYEGSLTWFEWTDQATVRYLGYESIDSVIGYMRLTGERQTLWRQTAGLEPRWWPRFSRGGNRIAVIGSDLHSLPQLWVGDLTATELVWQVITNLNPDAAERTIGKSQVISWTASDGMVIEGVLILPESYLKGEPLPLVTIVHGGPTAMQGARPTFFWAPYLVAEGMAVLMPNPRGSTGRGLAFAEANIGDMGGLDLADILAGVDFCVDQGFADPARLGIAGWSYGGFMAAWATTQTDRFKAAVVGAAIINWISYHGTAEIPTWDAAYMNGSAYGNPFYVERAPISHVDKVKTPTLILHGEKDTCVPVSQGMEWFRALRDHGVEAHLRIYPRAGHGPNERPHIRDVQQRSVAWFVKHLKG